MRAKEFKMLMEFSSFHSQEEMGYLTKHSDEIYFLQSLWKKYFGEVEYLKIYPHFKIDSSKIFSLAAKIENFLTEHKEAFRAEKSNLIFHGHIVEDYRFFYETIESHEFSGATVAASIDISNLIKFDQI